MTCPWIKVWFSSRDDLPLNNIYQPNTQDGEENNNLFLLRLKVVTA